MWALDSLSAALKLVRAAVKEAKAPASDGEPGELSVAVVVADADAGAAILADLRAYLAAASESDRLAVLVELESIVNG